jgi:MFS transporter, FSR family, fosmidomycin resistance protein
MLSGANSVVIVMAQELVPTRAGTASSLVMGLGWGVAGMVLLGLGSLAAVLGVPRALDLAMAVPLLASGLSLWLPHHGGLPSARVTRVGEFARHEE